jgi:hypothetical protein
MYLNRSANGWLLSLSCNHLNRLPALPAGLAPGGRLDAALTVIHQLYAWGFTILGMTELLPILLSQWPASEPVLQLAQLTSCSACALWPRRAPARWSSSSHTSAPCLERCPCVRRCPRGGCRQPSGSWPCSWGQCCANKMPITPVRFSWHCREFPPIHYQAVDDICKGFFHGAFWHSKNLQRCALQMLPNQAAPERITWHWLEAQWVTVAPP